MPAITDAGAAITLRNVLAVEGEDEKSFFSSLFEHMQMAVPDIRPVGGKDKFPRKIPALKATTGFDGVTQLGIVRDREGDNALASIQNILRMHGLEPPVHHGEFSAGHPKVGLFILPGQTIEGTMLEDLCLKTVEDHSAMQCVNDFSSCVASLETAPKNISKAKVQVFKAQTFLAAQPRIVDSVGLGAQKRYWDFDSPCLAELKEFLDHFR